MEISGFSKRKWSTFMVGLSVWNCWRVIDWFEMQMLIKPRTLIISFSDVLHDYRLTNEILNLSWPMFFIVLVIQKSWRPNDDSQQYLGFQDVYHAKNVGFVNQSQYQQNVGSCLSTKFGMYRYIGCLRFGLQYIVLFMSNGYNHPGQRSATWNPTINKLTIKTCRYGPNWCTRVCIH